MNTISTPDKKTDTNQQFLIDTLAGLRSNPKFMNSKYFYDQEGDRIFQQIMGLEEYYLTNCEMEILSQQAEDICRAIALNGHPFDLIELGAGDATKSIYLLKQLLKEGLEFSYLPIDISENVIAQLEQKLPEELPELNMKGLNGDYFDMLKKAAEYSNRRKVVLFMGANIGNMTVADANNFCMNLRNHLQEGDMVIVGFDLKKNPQQILSAYSDREGITSAFNLNLLSRINRELGGDFDLNNFEHYASYDPESGSCKSYLISLKDQTIQLNGAEPIHFFKNEPIFMEISQKYALPEIEQLLGNSGFQPMEHFFDQNRFFVDSIWIAAAV